MDSNCCSVPMATERKPRRYLLWLLGAAGTIVLMLVLQLVTLSLVHNYTQERAYRALLDTMRSELLVAFHVVADQGTLPRFLTRLEDEDGLSVSTTEGLLTIHSYPVDLEVLEREGHLLLDGEVYEPLEGFHLHREDVFDRLLGHSHPHGHGEPLFLPAVMPLVVLERQLAERINTSLRFFYHMGDEDGATSLSVAVMLPLREPIAIAITDRIAGQVQWDKEQNVLFILFGLSYLLIGLAGYALYRNKILQSESALEQLDAQCDLKNQQLEARAEEARYRETQLKALLSSVSDAILTVDGQGVIQTANRAALGLFRSDVDGLIGTPLVDHIRPETVHLRALFSDGFTEEQEASLFARRHQFDYTHSNGEVSHLEMRLSDFYLRDGRYFACLLRDVTEQVAAQEEARRAQNQLWQAISHLPDAFVLYDSDDRLLICNERYRELYKTSGDLFEIGNTFEYIVRTGAERGQYDLDGMSVDEWVADRMARHQLSESDVIQLLNDGRWVRVTERRTPDGMTVGFRSDITELKQQEEAVKAREEELRSIIATAMDAIVGVDANDRIIEFNRAAEALLGYKREEVLGKEAHRLLLPKEEWSRYFMVISALKRSNATESAGNRREGVVLDRAGEKLPVDISMNAAVLSTGSRFYFFLHDIRSRKRAVEDLTRAKENAEAAARTKTAFLAMMSHEIRTPLSAVIGFLRMLETDQLDAQQRTYVNTSLESAEALLGILNDILELSKLEAGQSEAKKEVVNLRHLIEQVRDLLLPRAQEKGLSLTIDMAEEVPEDLMTDSGRVRQVLINLTNNALKFTDQGGVTIRAESAGLTQDGLCSLRLSVIDTGVGIAPEHQRTIFSHFSRTPSAQATDPTGVGLGLAISKELVEGLGGHIGLQSAEGVGSVFWVELEVSIPPKNLMSPARPQKASETTAVSAGDMRFLVAEDNAPNRMVLCKMLEAFGAKVTEAENGRQAIDYLTNPDEDPVDAVFMDVSMPVLDGISATRALRDRHDLLASIPVIGLTAHTSKEDHDLMYAAGFTRVLTKPISREKLEHALQDLMARLGGLASGQPGAPSLAKVYQLPVRPHSAPVPPVVTFQQSGSGTGGEADSVRLEDCLNRCRTLMQTPTMNKADVEDLCTDVYTLCAQLEAEGVRLIAEQLSDDCWEAVSADEESLAGEKADLCRQSLYTLAKALEQFRSRLPDADEDVASPPDQSQAT